MKLAQSYPELHSDDITTLAFHPNPASPHLLLTASSDGLFSVVDCRLAEEDDAVLGVGSAPHALSLNCPRV